ncbi:carbon-nitrogen hydrolase family protein [Heyndrickxia coagulans]|uniref:carbon-nitrogen hydrolase family protein n=1 Tax=Heyndrickxia coagulans TaxID=1398 RepID=UPI0028F7E507|nr:carbon-nitrogen hydrolase family protein [Heyndrickxia coagulans]MDT9756939.1 carbon-nitrogen hydrolase family protein [Heyndrickxia coagulans]
MLVQIAIAQMEPVLGSKDRNVQKMLSMMNEAKNMHADLIIFPEMCLTGYHISDRLDELAEDLSSGESICLIQNACKTNCMHALYSFPEKGADDTFYISAILIDDEGRIAGVYRKTHLFDQESDCFSPGVALPVFETKFGKIGCMICYDLEFPEVARILRIKGAEMLLVPLANMSPYEHYQFIYAQSRAMENQIPVILCNRTGKELKTHFFGESTAILGDGRLTKKLGNHEQLEVVQIPANEKKDEKLNYLTDRRIDLYGSLQQYTVFQ